MSDEYISLDDNLLNEYKAWLAEIQNLAALLTARVGAYLANYAHSEHEKLVKWITNVGFNARQLLEQLPNMMIQVQPQSNRLALVEMLYELRTPVITIHAYTQTLIEITPDDLEQQERNLLEIIIQYAQLLRLIAQDASPYFKAFAND